ncbi:hypothetical protein OS493_004711 [Desmophyllum pertusum]|uniref:WW domain-containing protein n=1 Tax=Desmophyllum pertusum TaxID=174260 RepID=A0A9W9ZIA5_9CNID|nr:hypothetical protein OS493_004711 [Desmophyllum pertusum]
MANPWTQFQPWQNQPLPPGWEARYDSNLGRYYFIDHSTHKTSWTDPRVKKPEAIPLNQFKSKSSNTGGGANQLETSFGGTSSSSRQAVPRKVSEPVKPQRPASFGAADDDFPMDDSFLSAMLKEDKSEEDKEMVVKKKMIREFPGVDEVVIEVALRQHDESKAREIIKKLKGDDDKQRAPAKTKKQEPSKPKGKTSTASPLATSSSVEKLNKAKAAAKAKSSSQELHVKSKPVAEPKAARKTSPAPTTSPEPSKAKVTVVSVTGGHSGQTPAATQSTQAKRKMVSVTSKAYSSSLRGVPSGPNAANAQGSNPSMLLPEWVQPEGPQRKNRMGPQRSNREGPVKRPRTRKVHLNCGAQAGNLKGPNINLVIGSMYAGSSRV